MRFNLTVKYHDAGADGIHDWTDLMFHEATALLDEVCLEWGTPDELILTLTATGKETS